MRIISNYRDFYDTSGYIDHEIIFLRKQEEKILTTQYIDYPPRKVGLLGFCGKFYPYIHVRLEEKLDEKTGKLIPEAHYYYYSFEEYKNSKFWISKIDYRWSNNKEKNYANFFSQWVNSDKWFIELGVPYFKVKESDSMFRRDFNTVITNPSLLEVQFGKVMDAPTIFREVQFYLTNQLVKIKEPLEIDDKYKITQHGYDKYSFRNPIRLKDLK